MFLTLFLCQVVFAAVHPPSLLSSFPSLPRHINQYHSFALLFFLDFSFRGGVRTRALKPSFPLSFSCNRFSLFFIWFPCVPCVGVRLVYWSLRSTATFVIFSHWSMLLAFSLHFSSSSAFPDLIFIQKVDVMVLRNYVYLHAVVGRWRHQAVSC